MDLKDVKCEKCNRVIGQREGGTLHQFGMKVKFNKTSRITCPFIGCGHEQDFKVNKTKPFNLLQNNLDKNFCLT